MKSFTVYSKASSNSSSNFTIDEIANLRFVENGARPFFLLNITGIIYSFYRKLYLLGTILILWFIGSIVIKYIFNINSQIVFWVNFLFNLLLVIFGKEIEEYILKRKGFKIIEFRTARNKSEAAYMLQQKLSVKV